MELKSYTLPNYTLVEIKLAEGESIQPSILKDLKKPEVPGSKGVVISGRGPIWLYGHLVHHYHPSRWVATADPRLGYIVVASHTPEIQVSEIINPDEPIIV